MAHFLLKILDPFLLNQLRGILKIVQKYFYQTLKIINSVIRTLPKSMFFFAQYLSPWFENDSKFYDLYN